MVRIAAGSLAWFGLGVIIAEVLNSYDLFEFRLKALFVATPFALVYLLFQIILNHFEDRAKYSIDDEKRYQKITKIYRQLYWIVGLCLLFSIPFIWWGAIKKMATMANEGMKAF